MKQLLALLAAAVLLVSTGLWAGGRAGASVTEPGSPADPLVSKSYVDQVVTAAVSKAIDQAVQQKINQAVQAAVGTQVDARIAAAQALAVVTVEPGQRLVGSAGGELVLRTGEAAVVAGSGGGLADLTAGEDLAHGRAVPHNHLLLVPRGDGRGLDAVSTVIVLVRGGYSLTVAEEAAASE